MYVILGESMINVEITERSIRLSGHACRKASDGIDRACAAVSALTCSLINSLQDLTHDRVQAMAESGMTVIRWENLSDGGKLLLDARFLGLTEIG